MESHNTEQTVKRVYPSSYTGNTLKELNNMLKEGWKVINIITSKTDSRGGVISDYVLERIIINNKLNNL